MHNRGKLNYSSEADAISDVQTLRNGYVKTGAWNLPQIAFHLSYPVDISLKAPATHALSEKQQQAQGFLGNVIANGWPEGKLDAPEPMRPPDYVDPAKVSDLIESFTRLSQWPASHVDAILFGPVSTEKFRKFALIHAAHHLSFLVPTTGRRVGLRYSSEADVMNDVNNLRKGYKQTGGWNLPQICWHLSNATKFSMRPGPFPEVTEEQRARRAVKENILATGQLPSGLSAPETMVPPTDCGDAEIDNLAAALETARTFPGPFAPHRIFGPLTNDEARRLRLTHCAHHLSHLVPA